MVLWSCFWQEIGLKEEEEEEEDVFAGGLAAE